MPSASQTPMLSVKELNEVLERLQNKEEIPYLGTFSEVNIVFVAGLFLQYMQQKDDWKRVPCRFDLTDNKHALHYLKQIEELYGINRNLIFDKFPKRKLAESVWSSSFAPPIYITKKSLDNYFKCAGDDLQKKWISLFSLQEIYISKLNNKSNQGEIDYFAKQENITTVLEKHAAIYTFVFSVVYHKINPFVGTKKKGFQSGEDGIQRIWQFTEEYVRGLYELAKNIVEHSGQVENEGQGMITIRAYSDNETDKTKVLETHVFDYGDVGVIPKLKEYTDKKIKRNEAELSDDSQRKVNEAYKTDSDTLKKGFTLDDFINERALEQQNFRYISHYGINKLYKIIKYPLNGDMFIVSKGIKGKQEKFEHIHSQGYSRGNVGGLMLYRGTHYLFRIPFNAKNFGKIETLTEPKKPQELSTQDSSNALQKLMQKNIYKDIELDNLNEKSKDVPANSMLDITVKMPINKQSFATILEKMACLSELSSSIVVALNLEECSIDSESDLLRFLSYLTEEHKQSFVIYNLEFDVYKKMLDDNKAFVKTRSWEAFWSETKAMLVYTRVRVTDEEDKVKDFFFADILYGKTSANYYSINKILGNTFPNTASIIDTGIAKASSDINIHLSDFFHENVLLPYATLLKYDQKELSLINIKTIIQNDLLRKELFKDKEKYSSREIIEDYVNNIEGYHIANTHFKIGNKVHSEDFYYAKRLFQNSFYTTHLAMYIAIRIKNEIKNTNQKITLVGYEMYSELILSLVENNLKKIGWEKREKEEKINHFIVQNQGGELVFLPKDIFSDYIDNYKNRRTIVIVPIAATGSTARKIEKRIQSEIHHKERNIAEKNGKTEKEAKDIADQAIKNYKFLKSYNIILAQSPDKEFEEIRNVAKNDNNIIELSVKWHNIKNCELCYNKDKAKPLFDTDSSSLTPSLIFGNPEGKTKSTEGNEVESNIVFDDLNFENSIEYQSVLRNGNYRIYAVDSDRFIEENIENIKEWLKKIRSNLKETADIKLESTDNIVIVSPCHESNSKFINLINEHVFSSSATIIHHQNGVDFVENFSLLNRNYLTGGNIKVFYVDDSLITGSHFFELFDLVRKVKGEHPLTASILLNDQAVPFVHNRAVRRSRNYFAFTTFNQPPTLNIFANRPLEYERRRYETLQKCALHDTLLEHFHKKVNKLIPEKQRQQKEKSAEKRIRRLKMFEATHKIYDYFTKHSEIPDFTKEEQRKKFVDFKLKFAAPEYEFDMQDINQKALLKVLAQYPFILYKDLREKTFQWHKDCIRNMIETDLDKSPFNIERDYNAFSAFKFLLRRAAFLDNYWVLEQDFLEKLSIWFVKIDAVFESLKRKLEEKRNEIIHSEKELVGLKETYQADMFSSQQKKQHIRQQKQEYEEFKKIVNNLCDFPIFVLGNYAEMIQKNGWVAYKLLKETQKVDFEQSKKQGSQFLRMLKIEAATIIDDFMKMINKDHRIKWRDLYKDLNSTKLHRQTDEIVKFFNDDKRSYLLETNKFLAIKETFFDPSDRLIKAGDTPFVNYLWIKQLLFADCIDKDSYLPKEIKYQEKIEETIRKMKGFFSTSDIKAFFIVTDGQQIPHVILQDDNILNGFTDEFIVNLEIKKLQGRIEEIKDIPDKREELANKQKKLEYKLKEQKTYETKVLIDFLNGKECNAGYASETTAEFIRDNGEWRNIYTESDRIMQLSFLSPNIEWLYLIRISELTDKENKNGNGIFETQGLLGFYSDNKGLKDDFLPKQLLMLLRKDMSAFIDKHHKNDEFSLWIQEKEKVNYQFMLRHGIDEYKNPIENYFNKIYNLIPHPNHKSEKLKRYYYFELKHLTNKINLISKFNKFNPNDIDTYDLQYIVDRFYEDYEYILTFQRNGLYYLKEDDNVGDYIEIIDRTKSDPDLLRESIDFPDTLLDEMIFELVYNIRKHALNKYSGYIKKHKLIIYLDFEIKDNILCFKISNNYCERSSADFNCIYNNNKLDGLNLLNNILKKSKKGVLRITKTENSAELQDKIVHVYVPLKKMKDK